MTRWRFALALLALLALPLAACGNGSGSTLAQVDMAAPPDLSASARVKDSLSSAPELLITYAVTSTGLRVPTGLYNVPLMQLCSPGRTADRRLRCLPVNRAVPSDYFAEPTCGSRLYASDPECGGAVYVAESLSCGDLSLYPTIAFDSSGTTYIFAGGACRLAVLTPELRAKALYTRGARLPDSTFPALDEALGGG